MTAVLGHNIRLCCSLTSKNFNTQSIFQKALCSSLRNALITYFLVLYYHLHFYFHFLTFPFKYIHCSMLMFKI